MALDSREELEGRGGSGGEGVGDPGEAGLLAPVLALLALTGRVLALLLGAMALATGSTCAHSALLPVW